MEGIRELDECCCIEITCSYCKKFPARRRERIQGNQSDSVTPRNASISEQETRGRTNRANRRSNSEEPIPTRDSPQSVNLERDALNGIINTNTNGLELMSECRGRRQSGADTGENFTERDRSVTNNSLRRSRSMTLVGNCGSGEVDTDTDGYSNNIVSISVRNRDNHSENTPDRVRTKNPLTPWTRLHSVSTVGRPLSNTPISVDSFGSTIKRHERSKSEDRFRCRSSFDFPQVYTADSLNHSHPREGIGSFRYGYLQSSSQIDPVTGLENLNNGLETRSRFSRWASRMTSTQLTSEHIWNSVLNANLEAKTSHRPPIPDAHIRANIEKISKDKTALQINQTNRKSRFSNWGSPKEMSPTRKRASRGVASGYDILPLRPRISTLTKLSDLSGNGQSCRGQFRVENERERRPHVNKSSRRISTTRLRDGEGSPIAHKRSEDNGESESKSISKIKHAPTVKNGRKIDHMNRSCKTTYVTYQIDRHNNSFRIESPCGNGNLIESAGEVSRRNLRRRWHSLDRLLESTQNEMIRSQQPVSEFDRNITKNRSIGNQNTLRRKSNSVHELRHIRTEPGRARETYQEVNRHLDKDPIARRKHRRSRSAGSGAYHEHSDYTYGAAVGRLRNLLEKHEHSPHKKSVQFSPRSTGTYYGSPSQTQDGTYHPSRSLPLPPRGEIPNADETVRLLQNQSVVIQQMEAENRYCKSELVELKSKVKTVIEENRALHEALKRSSVEEILKQDIEVPGVPTNLGDSTHAGHHLSASGGGTGRAMTVQDYGKWQRELERITTLHTAKTSRLEAQLTNAKEEASKHEQEADTLKAKLRMQESMGAVSQHMGALSYGLCIKCSQNEAVTPATLANQQAVVDRITRERDELMDQLTSMKTTLQEMKQREEDAYAQVKKSVEMVEQAQLEETQALVQREQLKDELVNMRQRMQQHVTEMQEKMSVEREIVRTETKIEREELNNKLKEMTERLVSAEVQLDKTTRDKVSLMAELEAARGEISHFDTDYNKATDSMKMSMTYATTERNAAITELKRSKMSVEQITKESEYKISRLQSEVSQLRRRLSEAENELLNSKEQCIHLTTEIQTLERETHLAKLAKESIEKNRSDDVKAITRRAETREEELNMLIETLENKHGQTTSELDEIIKKQNGLVLKLRDECRQLTRQLEKLTIKYKGDNKHLASVNSAHKVSLDKCRKRVNDLDRQNHQYADQAEKMRLRLRQMDEHAKRGSGQILELLARESSLIRDRQLLAKEIEFLKREATSLNDSDLDKIFATRSEMIDDILKNVQNDEMDHKRDLKERSSAVLIETDRGMQTDDL